MRKTSLRWGLATVLLFVAAAGARADPVTFTAIPPAVTGTAGSTIGWGYSIVNNSTTEYLDITGIDSDLFLATDGIPDASVFDFPNIAPSDTVTQPYDPADNLGLFQFTWNPGVPVGTTEAGIFTLYGAFCDPSDPYCADDLSVQSVALTPASYSASVVAPEVTTTPEPGSFLLLTPGLVGLAIFATFRRKITGNSHGIGYNSRK